MKNTFNAFNIYDIMISLKEDRTMKKIIVILLATALTLSLITSSYAGGDKNRGDKGKGSVIQHQIKK